MVRSRLYSAVKKAAARPVTPRRSQLMQINPLGRPLATGFFPSSGLRMGKLVASLKNRG